MEDFEDFEDVDDHGGYADGSDVVLLILEQGILAGFVGRSGTGCVLMKFTSSLLVTAMDGEWITGY
ncbi:hypothetical protein AKJ16_DCAP17423 [Drosera capensis]